MANEQNQQAAASNSEELPAASEAVRERLESPLDNEGLPVTGVEALEIQPVEGGHENPSVLGVFDATVFVSLSMLVVVALVLWKKVPALIGASLDKKIADIREQLDEAKKLREESEKLRAKYESRLRAADDEAAEILAQAESEAELVVADAKKATTDLIARRKKMAEDKIAAAERSAIADVRAKAAGAATIAARNLIAAKHDAAADKSMIDKTISDLGTKLN
ncbi:F0F1 ATP synthase subunit B [Sphingorhabdus sp. EL138]|uniref:F0F1 ATP synthase subunit B family protein n=1 Tax=Sphingorhabdus sp. EL138 TaxID=2073156 RepID=UPI000D697D11|nr:F0F1 ATP synthase subunit B [Sphingorhabdus sp. EL138]